MPDTLTVKTNNVPRDVIDAWELSAAERKEFDYLNWEAIDEGANSATFFRYRGTLYDLGEFDSTFPSGDLRAMGWDAVQSESFFSAIVVRFVAGMDAVVVGLALT